mmetsp:Transcript_66307/g.209606  ORF Transcript_66307/g.209606 Transcript_66307/m.209606 type:complete len:213 (+) Transcript_66307:806-1444(+)
MRLLPARGSGRGQPSRGGGGAAAGSGALLHVQRECLPLRHRRPRYGAATPLAGGREHVAPRARQGQQVCVPRGTPAVAAGPGHAQQPGALHSRALGQNAPRGHLSTRAGCKAGGGLAPGVGNGREARPHQGRGRCHRGGGVEERAKPHSHAGPPAARGVDARLRHLRRGQGEALHQRHGRGRGQHARGALRRHQPAAPHRPRVPVELQAGNA